VLSEDAESTLFAVNELRTILPKRRRWSWRPWSQVQARLDQLQLELVFARLIGAGENYFVIHLTRLLKPVLLEEFPPPEPPDSLTKRLRKGTRDFRRIERMWASDMGVDVTSFPDSAEFEINRLMRHVLVHRLGRWEPGLDPKPKLDARISQLGENPKTYRGRFPLARADCARCADLVMQMVLSAEAAFGRP
jgi:hypothetical protein